MRQINAAVADAERAAAEADPIDDGVMINFPDGSVLTTEHFPESGRLRSWTVR